MLAKNVVFLLAIYIFSNKPSGKPSKIYAEGEILWQNAEKIFTFVKMADTKEDM